MLPPWILFDFVRSLYTFTSFYLWPTSVRGTLPSKDENLVSMLVISQVSGDPRVERSARALVKDGYSVRIFYPANYSGVPDWGDGIEFSPVDRNAAGFTARFPFLLGRHFLKTVIKSNPLIFHCHDLNTCLIGLVAARVCKGYLICDFHEWFSENISWNARKKCYQKHHWVRRQVYKLAEHLMVRTSDLTITVCDSIGKMIESETSGKYKVAIVRNIPPVKVFDGAAVPFRHSLGLGDDKIVILYQGGVGPSRLLEPVIEAMKHVEGAHLVIRGPGLDHYGEHYKRLMHEFDVRDKVTLLPPIESARVVEGARSADIGLWTLPNISKNFYYALPNKIFEYLAAELPILVANFPEPTKIVDTYGVGATFDPYNPQSIAESINRLTKDPVLRQRMRGNVRGALEGLNADLEWDRLRELYREMRESPPIQGAH